MNTIVIIVVLITIIMCIMFVFRTRASSILQEVNSPFYSLSSLYDSIDNDHVWVGPLILYKLLSGDAQEYIDSLKDVSYSKETSNLGLVMPKYSFHPTEKWMTDEYEKIKGKSVLDLCIPGTANSLTYGKRLHYEYFKSSLLDWIQDTFADDRTKEMWCKCQTKTLLEQLQDGIRYFDLKFAKYNNKFYSCNGLIFDVDF